MSKSFEGTQPPKYENMDLKRSKLLINALNAATPLTRQGHALDRLLMEIETKFFLEKIAAQESQSLLDQGLQGLTLTDSYAILTPDTSETYLIKQREERLQQARISFRVALIALLLGILLVFIGIILAFTKVSPIV